jgi:hypothetical protein
MAEALCAAYVETMEGLRARLSIEFLDENRCKRCDNTGGKCSTWRYHGRIEETQVKRLAAAAQGHVESETHAFLEAVNA